MLADLLQTATEELITRIDGSKIKFSEAEQYVKTIAKKHTPHDPTRILMIVSDDYRLLTYAPTDDITLKEEVDLTPILVIQYLIQEALEDGLWNAVDSYIVDDQDD